MNTRMTVAVKTMIDGGFIRCERRFISILRKSTSGARSVDAGHLTEFRRDVPYYVMGVPRRRNSRLCYAKSAGYCGWCYSANKETNNPPQDTLTATDLANLQARCRMLWV